MSQKKIVFIIPGFGHQPTNRAYKEIANMLKKDGYTPVSVKIPWKESTISDNIVHFINTYKRIVTAKKTPRKKIYILGFSYGAMIAFIASTKLKVDGLILCSLSPFFKEDISKIEFKKISTLEINRYKDFVQYSSKKLATETSAKKVFMLYGAEESVPLIHRVTKTYNEMSSPYKYLLPIGKTEHDIGNKQYLHTIQNVTSYLL
jgi:esterase/lipase